MEGSSPTRVELLVWFVIQEKLNTRSRLRRLNMLSEEEDICPFCKEEKETIKHMFLHCHLSWKVWMNVLDWWGLQMPIVQTPSGWFECWLAGIEAGGFQKSCGYP